MKLLSITTFLVLTISTRSFANSTPNCGVSVSTSSFPATVESVHQITASTLNLRISKPDGFKANPGEAVKVTIHSPGATDQFRYLSISSSTESSFLDFTVRNSESEFKKAFGQLKKGDRVTVSAPRGALKYNPEKPAVFIAGGIGITPFRSILLSLQDQKRDNLITLLYANRSEAEIAFKHELEQLHGDLKNFNVQHIVGEARIDKELLQTAISQHPENTVFYIVGPPPMVKAMKALLTELGLKPDRISVEMFAGYQ